MKARNAALDSAEIAYPFRHALLRDRGLRLLKEGLPAEARTVWLEGRNVLRSAGMEREVEARTSEMRSACFRAGEPALDAAPG